MQKSVALVIAGMAFAFFSGSAHADDWFMHKFGEMRAYFGDWLAVCADQGNGPCRAVQSAKAPGSRAAFDRRLTLHNISESGGWAVEVMDRGMNAADVETLVFTFDGARVDIPSMQWQAGGLESGNVSDALTITDPKISADLVNRMRKGNRLVVTYAPVGEGDGRASFSLRGVTAGTRAIEEQVAAMPKSSSSASPSMGDLDDQQIVSTVWTWEGFQDESDENNIVVPNPENYRLQLKPDGSFSFLADCNSGSGGYKLDGNGLSFDPLMATTLAECGPGSLYNTYLRLLFDVRTFVRRDDQLYLNLMADGGNMKFTKLHAVTGVITSLDGVDFPKGTSVEVKISDVSLADVAAKQVGGQIIYDAKQFPINFEASYDASSIMPQNTYGAQVSIRDADGKLLYTNTYAVDVITRGNPTYDIAITVDRMN